jgi:type IV secretion system protein VirB2
MDMINRFSNYIKTVLALLSFLVFLISSQAVSATDSTVPSDPTGIITIFCNVINQATGGVGKVICVLILISMAIGLFLGKITWGLAIAVMVGMGMLFGATGLVDLISSGSNTYAASVNTSALCAAAG